MTQHYANEQSGKSLELSLSLCGRLQSQIRRQMCLGTYSKHENIILDCGLGWAGLGWTSDKVGWNGLRAGLGIIVRDITVHLIIIFTEIQKTLY